MLMLKRTTYIDADSVFLMYVVAAASQDVTVVISAKDFISQVPEQLTYISKMLPSDIKIIYTFPKPMGYKAFHEDMVTPTNTNDPLITNTNDLLTTL